MWNSRSLFPAPSAKEMEPILQEVAAGRLSTTEAAEQIRRLFVRQIYPPWAVTLFRILGIGFLIGGIAWGAYSASFGLGAAETRGTVVQVDGGRPIVRYEVNGQVQSHRSPISSKPPAYAVGEQVSVLYRPENPGRAVINSFTDRWLFPTALAGMGLVLTLSISFILKLVGAKIG